MVREKVTKAQEISFITKKELIHDTEDNCRRSTHDSGV